MVWPSFVCIESEQGAPGHLHCFSRKGAPYVSNLLHTENGEQTGRSVSDSWGGEFMSRLRRGRGVEKEGTEGVLRKGRGVENGEGVRGWWKRVYFLL